VPGGSIEPAAAVVDRYATRQVRLGGAEIAAGDLVRISITAANRDPAVFAEFSTVCVSPVITTTRSTGQPSWSATTCANT